GRTSDENIEVFCNHVAGAILVPAAVLLGHARVRSMSSPGFSEADIRNIAEDYSVSREVVLRRLLILGRTTEEFYQRKRDEYLEEYRRLSQQRDEEEEEDAGGFAPHFRIALRNNGRRYTRLVLDALEHEGITPADVTDFLGVRLKHLDEMAAALRRHRFDT